MARDNELDTLATVVVALVGAILVVVAVIALQAYYYHAEDRSFEEAYAQPNLEVVKVKAEQEELLTSYSLPDTAKGTIRIPIDRAMELVAREAAAAQAQDRGKVAEKP
jgi:hypothetical protein